MPHRTRNIFISFMAIALLCSFGGGTLAAQDNPNPQDPDRLIQKLNSDNLEEQGKAAQKLVEMGEKAVPALEKALMSRHAEVRDWCRKILARMGAAEKKIRGLIEKLGSSDFSEQGKAAQELKKIGSKVIPFLREAEKSPKKGVREWAKKILTEIKTEPIELLEEKPFKGKGDYDTVGGGGGSRFAGRISKKKELVNAGGGGANTEDAVLEALKWLARHQAPDGSWGVKEHTTRCGRNPKYETADKCPPSPGSAKYRPAVTGLSVLAFLGAGYSHTSKEIYDGIHFATVVKNGLKWMVYNQDSDGCIGSRTTSRYMYNHLICTLAISEAYGLTRSPLFKGTAQRAVNFAVGAQNPGLGWRYSYRCGDNDSSVTGWGAYALHAARLAGLSVPEKAGKGVLKWFDQVTEKTYFRVGYSHKGTGKVYVPGMNEKFEHHETLTAFGVASRIFSGTDRGERVVGGGCELLVRDLPKWEDNWIDFYYWHHASLALFQYDGSKGTKWGKWNRAMKTALVKNQNAGSSGCKSGSWEPVGRWCGESGRVYATALNALTLETYYRYRKEIPKEK